MRKQTDLAKVKQTARSLLFTDIHETEFSPVIVSHPFTDSGFVASPNAVGEIGLLDITESDTLSITQNFLRSRLCGCEGKAPVTNV